MMIDGWMDETRWMDATVVSSCFPSALALSCVVLCCVVLCCAVLCCVVYVFVFGFFFLLLCVSYNNLALDN